MISNPKLQDLTRFVPVMSVIIDEASQIEVGQYIPLFKSFGETLRNLCFIGDDKQCELLLVLSYSISVRAEAQHSTLCSAATWSRRPRQLAIYFRT